MVKLSYRIYELDPTIMQQVVCKQGDFLHLAKLPKLTLFLSLYNLIFGKLKEETL